MSHSAGRNVDFFGLSRRRSPLTRVPTLALNADQAARNSALSRPRPLAEFRRSDTPDHQAVLIIEAFDNVIKRELAEADEVREKIKRRGTYWAGDEIWKPAVRSR